MKTSLTLWLRDNRGFLAFLLAFGLMRTAIADWNPIPSGSMRPHAEGGRHGAGQPRGLRPQSAADRCRCCRPVSQRIGDVVTFSSP